MSYLSYLETDGELILKGDSIAVGISDEGSFGTTGDTSYPADVGEAVVDEAFADSQGVGLSYDADTFGAGSDIVIDFFLPGSPEERWSIFYESGGVEYWGGYSTLSDVDVSDRSMNLTDKAISDLSSGSFLSGEFTATAGVVDTTHVHSFNSEDLFFTSYVTLVNNAGGNLENVQFMRSFDPDNTVYAGGEYDTLNTVNSTYAENGYSMVTASSISSDTFTDAFGDSSIFYYSDDSRSEAYADGFSNSYIPDFSSLDQEMGFEVEEDGAIGIIFNLGQITSGGSASFEYVTSLASAAEAGAVLAQLTAGGGSIEAITDTGTLENEADEAGDGSSVNFVSETAELDESPVQVIDTRLAEGTSATTVSDPFKELAFNGGDAADYVVSGVFSDTIMTGGGNDIVNSSFGDDIINTGSGNDVIYGGAGNNVIDAGSGDDTVVVGGNENSTITLGTGSDHVIVNVLTSLSPSFTSSSTVVDFSSAEGDILNFDYGLPDISFGYQELTTSGEAGTAEGFEQALAVAEASNSGADGGYGVVAVEANGGTYVFFDSGDEFGVTSSVLLSGGTLDDLSANNIVL